ncbi:2-C-methyl-D-erythritol 4-phosphate cytidylyltransferase [Conexibacter sp. DBS9H8]|uniref:2-C-methyl-D-erythritol 4-phosphate cytidylyltransferase n=1 Tax=Conexibacter sp. DBS9H8 TaxID=2937801 RepID=UPI0020102F2D|nr:2-C-methyl-D-erythritol 4-phosphate cytidylyltransferase [Conexibacter sp. DBS9H8]
MAVALVVAAGSGERLGAGGPKALVPVAGRPMWEWSVAALSACPEVSAIVLALPADHVEACRLPPGVTAVPGGVARSASVAAALAAAPPGDPVIVHDAARPLLTPALITSVLVAWAQTGADAVIAALPVTDTIKRVPVGETRVTATLPRVELWAVQTPQVFGRAALAAALAAAGPEGLAAATDDAGLIEAAGGTVHVVKGDPENIKITVPADLMLAEARLAARAGAAADVGRTGADAGGRGNAVAGTADARTSVAGTSVAGRTGR